MQLQSHIDAQRHLRICYSSILQYLIESKKRVIFTAIGKPASGKDRQAKILNDAGVPFLRTSALLDGLPQEHPLNRDYRKIGLIAPGKEVGKFVLEDIQVREFPSLLFLNGSPRSTEEVSLLYPQLQIWGYRILAIELNIPDELALVRRLSDVHGGLVRPDAGTERDRLKTYAEKTYPVFNFGREFGVNPVSILIDEKTEPFDVAMEIKAHLERFVFLSR